MKVFIYDDLRSAELVIDAIYEGGGSVGELGDPISILLPGCGNLGGFNTTQIVHRMLENEFPLGKGIE